MDLKNILVLFSEFLLCVSYTVLASFYPGLAKSKGISLKVIGIILSLEAFTAQIVSLYMGKYMNKIGRRFAMTFGLSMITMNIFLIGCLEDSNYMGALIISIFMRISAGIGSGTLMVASSSILISENIDKTDTMMSYLNAASGLGYTFGPLFSTAFGFISFKICFFSFSGFYLLFTVLSFFALKNLKKIEITTKHLSLTSIIFKPVIFR